VNLYVNYSEEDISNSEEDISNKKLPIWWGQQETSYIGEEDISNIPT